MLETRKFKDDTVLVLKKIIIWLWSPLPTTHIYLLHRMVVSIKIVKKGHGNLEREKYWKGFLEQMEIHLFFQSPILTFCAHYFNICILNSIFQSLIIGNLY